MYSAEQLEDDSIPKLKWHDTPKSGEKFKVFGVPGKVFVAAVATYDGENCCSGCVANSATAGDAVSALCSKMPDCDGVLHSLIFKEVK